MSITKLHYRYMSYDALRFADWFNAHYRKSSFKSFSAIGERIGTSRATISRYANASVQGLTGQPSQPDRENVIKLAKLFNADVDEALLIAGYAPISSEKETRAVNTALRFDRLPQTEKERLSKLLEFLDAEIEKIEKREKNM